MTINKDIYSQRVQTRLKPETVAFLERYRRATGFKGRREMLIAEIIEQFEARKKNSI